MTTHVSFVGSVKCWHLSALEAMLVIRALASACSGAQFHRMGQAPPLETTNAENNSTFLGPNRNIVSTDVQR